MITFHQPEWIESPGCVSLHAEVLLDAGNPTHGVLPCPFCGNQYLTITNTHTPCFKVVCDTCEAEVAGKAVQPRTSFYKSRKAALQGYRKAFKFALLAWTKRAQPQPLHLDFNINHYVMVRLTDRGHSALRQIGYKPPQATPEGFTRWQLWELMRVFGPHIGPCFNDCPIETTITLCLPIK